MMSCRCCSLSTYTIIQHAARELHTWSKCNHPNVIPLLGLAVFRGRIGMVSPWMGLGNLPHYLEQEPEVNRQNMVRNGLVTFFP